MSIADAVLSAVTAAVPAVDVYDAHVPRRADGSPLTLRCVVVYPDLGVLSAPALCGTLAAADITFRLVYVATTRGEVEAISGAVRPVIVDRTFTAAPWTATFDPDQFHNTTPITWDESIADRLVMYATDEFRAFALKS